MDRQIVYIGAIPQDTDFLLQNRNAMVGLGLLIQSLLGTSTLFSGLACVPTSPPSMQVTVGEGAIYSQQSIDASAYGSLDADTTDSIMKQGILLAAQAFTLTAPPTVGQSVVYLVEAAYEDVDAGDTVLPYYNAANPAMAWSGPNNTGVSQKTVRKGACLVQVKTGVAATTGTQTVPAPDAGFIGLYAITVAHGATTITSGNIQQLASAPFIPQTLPQILPVVQTGAQNYAVDTSVTANAITVALTPAISALTPGMHFRVKMANTTIGGAVNMTPNGIASYSVINQDGSNPASGQLVANGIYDFVFDGAKIQVQGTSTGVNQRKALTADTTYHVATTGNDSTGDGSTGAPWATISHALGFIQQKIDLAGFSAIIQLADGTYTDAVISQQSWVGGYGSSVTINGNSVTPSNTKITVTGAESAVYARGANCGFTVSNVQIKTITIGNLIHSDQSAYIYMGEGIILDSAADYQIITTNNGNILVTSNYSIIGGAKAHVDANSGIINYLAGLTITLTGTPNFSQAYGAASINGSLNITGQTFSGSATGLRYTVNSNGVINTNGAGATYLPGSVSGTAITGGEYV